MLTIVTPAADRYLLSIYEMRSAAGLDPGDSSRDGDLWIIAKGIFDRIATECSVAGDGIRPPTLKRETVAETIRLRCPTSILLLSRRFVGAVNALTIDGSAVDASGYEIDPGAGVIRRLCGGWPARRTSRTPPRRARCATSR